jgi:DNA topoisomerase-3
MIVILAEKPQVAASIAASLKEVTLSNGEILETKHLSIPKYERLIKEARKDGYFKGTRHLITYAYGHLFTLKEPDQIDASLKSWKMNLLPFHFEDIPLKMVAGRTFSNNKKQFDTIKKMFNNPSTTKIFVATDAGREGEHIFRTIYHQTKCKKSFDRMWLKDMTEEGITKAYKKAKRGQEYNGLAEAAKCRAEADYLVGLNLTRGMTIKFGGFKNVLSIGRVQTPTLAILVKREAEITNFVPEDYFTLKATFAHLNGDYEGIWHKGKQDRFATKADGDLVLQRVANKHGVLTKVVVKDEKERNPLPFDLTELQRTMNKSRGFSASKTLEIAQKLYDEHKLITYPRTSSRYLSTGTGKTVGTVLRNLASSFGSIVNEAIEQKYSFSKYMINDAKTSDHEAIIPTLKAPNLGKLDPNEMAVYETIVKRFVSAFYPICIWEQVTAETTVEGELFKSSGKSLKQVGWRKVEGIPKAKILPELREKDAVDGKSYELEAKKTQPPKRMTDADLLSAMENAGRFVEEEELKEMLKEGGIGTPATRSNIIDELVRRGYVRREKNILVPTEEKGIPLISILPVETLKSPEMTALWERKLSEIEKGISSRQVFMQEMKQSIQEMIQDIQNKQGEKLSAPTPARSRTQSPTKKYKTGSVYQAINTPAGFGSGETNSRGESLGKVSAEESVTKSGATGKENKMICACPSCGGEIRSNSKAYSCSNWKNGCKVTIWKNSMEKLGKKSITQTEAKQLLAKGKTTKKVKLHSTAKAKDYEAFLTLDSNYRVGQAFN